MNIMEIDCSSKELKPLKGYLVVKPQSLTTDVKSTSGIIVETRRSTLDRPCSAVVIAAGENEEGLSASDVVVYPNTDGLDIKLLDSDDNNKYMLLKVSSVIAVIKK